MTVSNLDPDLSTLPPASESAVRARAGALHELAARYGITELRFASAGRLVGHVAEDRDALDTAAFEVEARKLLHAEVGLFPDRVLAKQNVSPDLVAARAL
jgi:hypothetical protein